MWLILSANMLVRQVSKVMVYKFCGILIIVFCKFQVIESDPLPNQVCIECWTKIENFHDFYTSIQTAQARYLSDLVKYERETNHFVDVLESVHLNFDEPIDVLASVADEQNEAAIKNEYELPKQIFIEETSEHLTNETIEYDETSNDDCFETRASERTGGETESGKRLNSKTLSIFFFKKRIFIFITITINRLVF